MCLMAFDWQPHATRGDRLTLVGNRDEFHARATTGLCRWPDESLCGGRDLVAGGGWLVLDQRGALAALTNVRQLDRPAPSATVSRGRLVTAAVRQAVRQTPSLSLAQWLQALAAGESVPAALEAEDAHRLAPLTLDSLDWFNLLVCDGSTLWQLYHGPEGRQLQRLPAGVHSLSNGHPDNQWPKQQRLVQRLTTLQTERPEAHLKDQASRHDAAYLDMLHDDWRPPSELLPATGLDLAREALLSSPFITSPEYGTRASSLVRWAHDGALALTERRFSPEGECIASRRASLKGRQNDTIKTRTNHPSADEARWELR